MPLASPTGYGTALQVSGLMRGLFADLDVFRTRDLFNATFDPGAGLLDHIQTLISLGDVPFRHFDNGEGIANMVERPTRNSEPSSACAA